MQLPLLNFPNHQGCRELNLGLILIFSVFFLQGVRSSTVNACANGNPCKNEGVCIATDNGPICDCTRTEFTGLFCQEGELKRYVQVYNFQKVSFVYHFFKGFERKMLHDSTCCVEKSVNFFNKLVN